MTNDISLYQHIYTLVKQIPQGQVASYGSLAGVAGTTARVVGFALAVLPEQSAVPWQRVINSQGAGSAPERTATGQRYNGRCWKPKVCFDASSKVDSVCFR